MHLGRMCTDYGKLESHEVHFLMLEKQNRSLISKWFSTFIFLLYFSHLFCCICLFLFSLLLCLDLVSSLRPTHDISLMTNSEIIIWWAVPAPSEPQLVSRCVFAHNLFNAWWWPCDPPGRPAHLAFSRIVGSPVRACQVQIRSFTKTMSPTVPKHRRCTLWLKEFGRHETVIRKIHKANGDRLSAVKRGLAVYKRRSEMLQ